MEPWSYGMPPIFMKGLVFFGKKIGAFHSLFHGLLSFFSDLKYIPQPDINRLIFVWALFCFLFVSWSRDFYHSRFLISPLFLSRIFYEDAQLKKCDMFSFIPDSKWQFSWEHDKLYDKLVGGLEHGFYCSIYWK
jgi:hypothetical protein